MRKEKRKEAVKRHPFSIFQDKGKNGKEGRWRTNIIDKQTGKKKQVAKTKKSDLEDFLVDYYESETEKKTLRTLYPEWAVYESEQSSITNATLARLCSEWNNHWLNEEIVDVPITELTTSTLRRCFNSMIKNNGLTKKQFYNRISVIKHILDYAADDDCRLILHNPYNSVKINKRLFAHKPKKKANERIYNTDEQTKVVAELKRRFEEYHSITPLAIALNFHLGLRVGELVAIKYSDISDGYINICRSEFAQYNIVSDNGKVVHHRNGVCVEPRTKSDDGIRDIYLNEYALEILKLIEKVSKERNLYDDGYICVCETTGKRTTAHNIDHYLADVNETLGIPNKSNHAIRRSNISMKYDNGVKWDIIRQEAGHSHISTTFSNYYYNCDTDVERKSALERAKNDAAKW
jgi:integrase